MVTPLIILSLIVFYHRTILKKKIYYKSILLFGVLIIPLFTNFVQNFESSRANSEFIGKDIAVNRQLVEYSNPIARDSSSGQLQRIYQKNKI